uniref:HTH araC/xylS-type domain-containing protein n=1 Tax=Thermosporothrix sp. COM3 TaxID=2490863 RepID=A0A455SIL2_9CHLR|nr:hypothetical protein KTC_21510 [Thermosporothrix sp. COM3]
MEAGFWPAEAVVGEVIYPPGGSLGPRLQRNLQLVLLHTGEMTIAIDGKEQHVPAKSVCVLFPQHEERFSFAKQSPTYHSWLHLFAPEIPDTLLARLNRLPWPLPLSPAMMGLLHEALSIQKAPFPTAHEMLKALGLHMLWRYIGEGEQLLTGISPRGNAVVEQAQHFIHAHVAEPLTLDQIASAVALSQPYLIRLFRTCLQTTPMRYVWQVRIARGIELLEQTGLPVGIIAERCGFQSRYHFARCIRQTTGYSPLEVRRRSWQRRVE